MTIERLIVLRDNLKATYPDKRMMQELALYMVNVEIDRYIFYKELVKCEEQIMEE